MLLCPRLPSEAQKVRTAVAAPVSAQAPAADKWTVTVAPCLMGAAMKGTTAVAGQEATLDFFVGRVNYLSTNLRINSPLQVRSIDGSRRASLEFGYRWLDIDSQPKVGLQWKRTRRRVRWSRLRSRAVRPPGPRQQAVICRKAIRRGSGR